MTWQPQQVRLGAIVITLNSDVFTIPTRDRERSYTLDVPAQVIGGSTMVPIRAILESVVMTYSGTELLKL